MSLRAERSNLRNVRDSFGRYALSERHHLQVDTVLGHVVCVGYRQHNQERLWFNPLLGEGKAEARRVLSLTSAVLVFFLLVNHVLADGCPIP